MARRIVSNVTLTPTATGDSANLVDATYPFMVQGGTSTQVIKIHEISETGQATSATPTIMLFSRDSQVGTGSNTLGSGQTDAAMDPATATLAAIPLVGNSNATNKPQRSSSLHLMNCSINAFGGVFFWRANRWEECSSVLGNTASFGEVSLSAFTGGTPGLIGSHLIYEPL